MGGYLCQPLTPGGHPCPLQQFHRGAPLWHPDEKLNRTQVAELWEGVYTHLEQAVGNCEACMAVGLTLAYAANPEIFRQYRTFPGLWVHLADILDDNAARQGQRKGPNSWSAQFRSGGTISMPARPRSMPRIRSGATN